MYGEQEKLPLAMCWRIATIVAMNLPLPLMLVAALCGQSFAQSSASAPTTAPAAARYLLAELNRDGIPPLLPNGAKTTEGEWDAKRDAIRAVWHDYIGGLPPRVPTKYEVVSETPETLLRREARFWSRWLRSDIQLPSVSNVKLV